MRTRRYVPDKMLLFLMIAAMLGGCTKEELGGGEPLPEGKYPLEFTSQMYGMVVTRATSGNTWDGGEEIALRVASDTRKYTVSDKSTGKISAAAGTTPFYWTSTTETKTVSAYYPFALASASTITVNSAQNNAANYQASDALYAATTSFNFKDATKSLIFKHLPAKVVANLKQGDGVTAAEVQGATVKFVSQSLTATFNNATGAVTVASPGSSSVASNVLTTPASGFDKSVQALLVPCQMKGNKFIEVTIGSDKFYYTPTNDTDGKLESGKVCTYEITVKRDGIEVVLTESGAWGNGGNEDVQSNSQPMKFTIEVNSTLGMSYILPFKTSGSTGSYTLVVDWGDGSGATTINPGTTLSSAISHSYAEAKEYIITISTTEEDFSKEQIPGFRPGNYRTTSNNKLKLKLLLTPLLNTGETDFTSCFFGCKNLTGSIPENLFINNPQVKILKKCFRGCSGLTGAIPENLFAKNPLVEDFNDCFAECSDLTGAIPEGLFAYNPEVTTFYYVFFNCRSLTSIPSKLFKNNAKAENFEYAFGDCSSLSSIPSGLFDNNPAVTNFMGCFALVQIPSSNMSGSIPTKLFAKNLKAMNFKQCFQGQTKLLLNSDIFCEETLENKASRFAGQTVDFSYCFYKVGSDLSVSGAAGTAPALWDYTGTFTSTECFNGIGTVTNANSIPDAWKNKQQP